jgi:hypothetical protein
MQSSYTRVVTTNRARAISPIHHQPF